MHLTRFLLFGALYIATLAASKPLGAQQQQFFSSDSNFEEGAPVLNSRLDAAIQGILKEFKTPGGAGVAVVRKTAAGTWVLESKGYGNATAGAQADKDTLFAIGSNSKLFDVLATGLLISNETLSPRISWDSKIASILPAWKLKDPVATSESTIVDIMSHRTGLPRHDFMEALDEEVDDIISRLQYLRPSTGFREKTQYNNHMYTVLSSFPRTLLNVSFESYVHDNIFVPLGLNATTYYYADASATGKLADGFTRENVNVTEDPFGQGTIHTIPFWDRSTKGHVISGAGGVISSAHDMAIWLQALLQEGVNQANETVIPAAVIRKVATGVTVYTPVAEYPELSPVVYGGAQMRGTYRGFEMIEHGGSTPGFKSQVTRFPSENLGIAVLTNDEELGTSIEESIKYRIVDEVFSLSPHIDWPARYRKKIVEAAPPPPLPRPTNAQPPSIPYTALSGIYHNAGYQGHLDFCLFWANATQGSSCAGISSEFGDQLLDVIDLAVPTLISRRDTMLSNYLQFSHYNGNTFNLTALQTYPRENPPWVRKIDGLGAEFEVDGEDVGFALIGIWGAGAGVEPPKGETVRERAEVWFSKA